MASRLEPRLDHADWMHLAFNMFVLYEFGQTVAMELSFLGWMGFPALYLAESLPVQSLLCKGTGTTPGIAVWARQGP